MQRQGAIFIKGDTVRVNHLAGRGVIQFVGFNAFSEAEKFVFSGSIGELTVCDLPLRKVSICIDAKNPQMCDGRFGAMIQLIRGSSRGG